MTTPTPDYREHVLIPLDAHGKGPCAEDEACEYRCWCGERGCKKWTEPDPNDV